MTAEATSGASLRVITPGMLTTVQDLGRYGYERFGLGVAGALDDCALRWANLLAGNLPRTAAIEATLLGPTLVYEGDAPLVAALTGAECGATLNRSPLAAWRGFLLRPGDALALSACQQGARTYLAVRGGIATAPALGSRSTDLLGHLGGMGGRALRAGDLVPVAASGPIAAPDSPAEVADQPVHPLLALPADLVPRYEGEAKLRVVLGPQDDRFSDETLATFGSAAYTVTPQTDRMGMRLAGPALAFRPGSPGADILSEGIVTGAIQVPGHGQPIILLAGHQTTGGYAKIATVIGADLWRLGQARPGDCVRFQVVAVAEAQEARRAYHASFDPARLVALPARVGHQAPTSLTWTAQQVDELLDRAGSLGISEQSLRSDG